MHPLTLILIINNPWSASSIYYDLYHPPCSITCFTAFLHIFCPSPLIYFLAWNPPLHTPYISSPNHCLLFATHFHTITTCFAVVLRLCHLFLVCLSTLTLSFALMSHIHLTILISACWSAIAFSFLRGQVSLPCNMPLHTQLLLQCLSHNQWYIHLDKQWCQLPEFISSSWNSGICSCISISIHTQHVKLNNKTYPLTPGLPWHRYLHLCSMC